MRHRVIALLLLSFVVQQVVADTDAPAPKTVAELSTALSNLSDACSAKASKYSSADQLAIFQSGLDRQLADQKVQDDVQLYRIGHGGSETNQHMIELMQQEADESTAAQKQLSQKMDDETTEITTCTTSAENDGKATYSKFKASRKKGQKMDEAESLMTAWLVEIKAINKGTPKGSNEVSAAWQTAKAHAELESL